MSALHLTSHFVISKACTSQLRGPHPTSIIPAHFPHGHSASVALNCHPRPQSRRNADGHNSATLGNRRRGPTPKHGERPCGPRVCCSNCSRSSDRNLSSYPLLRCCRAHSLRQNGPRNAAKAVEKPTTQRRPPGNAADMFDTTAKYVACSRITTGRARPLPL